ncbi:hypothetical protein ES708_04980 [subsurface metagenome]
MFISVLLPAPFSPSNPCTSPALSSNVILSFASTLENCFVMPTIRKTASSPITHPFKKDPASSAYYHCGAGSINKILTLNESRQFLRISSLQRFPSSSAVYPQEPGLYRAYPRIREVNLHPGNGFRESEPFHRPVP